DNVARQQIRFQKDLFDVFSLGPIIDLTDRKIIEGQATAEEMWPGSSNGLFFVLADDGKDHAATFQMAKCLRHSQRPALDCVRRMLRSFYGDTTPKSVINIDYH